MVKFTDADNQLISNAIWSHPSGVAFNTKLTQIAECCHNMGNKHSGVTRIWMYELYAESIEQDHKERGINQPEPVVAATPQPVPQKPVIKRARRARAKLERKPAHKPLPRYAPAFVKPIDTPSIIEYLAELTPLPRLQIVNKETKEAQAKAVEVKRKKKKEQKELEYLLLMAA